MQCENCGAPMRKPEGSNYYVCDYCLSFKYPESIGTPDNITSLDENTEYQCPVCRETLKKGFVGTKEILFCENCKGLLIKSNDLAGIISETPSLQNQAKIKTLHKITQEELQREIFCPICGKKMDTHPYYGPGHVVIDSCPACYQIWFDAGELTQIIVSAK